MGQFTFDDETTVDRYVREAFLLYALDPEFTRACNNLLLPYHIRWRDPVLTESAQMRTGSSREGYL